MRILGQNRFNLRSSVAMAPPEIHGMGGFGGEGGGGEQQTQMPNQSGGGEDQHAHVPLFGFENNEEESGLDDILSAFKTGDDDDDSLEPDDTQNRNPDVMDVPQEQVEALNTKIMGAIKNMKIPDDAIPQDFDFSDRTQVTNLMNRTVQAAVAQSLQVVFQPVQLALQHMVGQIESRVDAKIDSSRDNMSARAILEQIVPEAANPKYAPLVQQFDATLKANGKKPKERAQTIRKMLNQMGIKEGAGAGNRRASNPGGGGGQSVRTGAAALDSFFGAFPKMK